MKSNSKGLLGLCSAAILCVSAYAVVEGKSHLPGNTQIEAQSSSTRRVAPRVAAHKETTTKHSSTHAKPVKKATVKQKYKDGTYTGVGNTRIGAVQVSVTLKSDKITDVKITNYSTHYPISYIDPVLPQELIARQDVNKIDVVSGATMSTEDFYYAVVSCLQQAQTSSSSSSIHA